MSVRNTERILEKDLERLKKKLALNEELNIVWKPDPAKTLSGEVKGSIIIVYESQEDKAVETLRHEVLDHYLTSRLVNPLVGLVNLLIKSRESEIYREKEKIVEVSPF